MARETRGEWAKRIEEWGKSGLTGAEYAARVGVKESTLRHWKWAVERGDRTGAKGVGGVRFVRVARVGVETGAGAERIELVVRDGIRIRVPEEFNAEALRRVLQVVGVG